MSSLVIRAMTCIVTFHTDQKVLGLKKWEEFENYFESWLLFQQVIGCS